MTPTTVYNVEYMHWLRVENIWLSLKSLVGGYHIGSKMAVFKWPLYPLCQTPMCMPPAAAHIEAHEPKPSQSTDVYAQYNLLKLLVGFK